MNAELIRDQKGKCLSSSLFNQKNICVNSINMGVKMEKYVLVGIKNSCFILFGI